MYPNVYVIQALVRSISGRHKMTEEDYGLPPGTLPPEDLATLGNLITVDPKLLREPEKLRQRTNRVLQNGVKCASGAVFTEGQFQETWDELNAIKGEYEDVIQKIVDNLEDSLEERMQEHPKYADLIRKYAPDVNYVKRRMSYHIDVYKLAVPTDDPHADVLASTLKRSGNDISKRLIKEVSNFVSEFHESAFQKTKKLVKQSLGRLRDTLLPKVESFALLDSSLRPIAMHLDAFIKDVTATIDAKPKGAAWIEGGELVSFEARIKQLMTPDDIRLLIECTPAQKSFATKPPARSEPAAQPEPPRSPPLMRRPEAPDPSTNGRREPRPIRF